MVRVFPGKLEQRFGKVGFSLILGMLLLIPISGPFVFLTNAKGFNAAGVGAAAGNSLPISDAAYFRSIECHFRIRIHILYSVHFENWPTLSLFFFSFAGTRQENFVSSKSLHTHRDALFTNGKVHRTEGWSPPTHALRYFLPQKWSEMALVFNF